MNISPDGKTISFKTDTDDLFMAEKSGAKPNTVRIIDSYEHEQLKKKLPSKIILQHQQEIILRTITHVYVSEQILGKYLAVFSWTNEDHHHTKPKEEDHDPGAHNMQLDDSASTTRSPHTVSLEDLASKIELPMGTMRLPIATINDLIHHSGKESVPQFISKLIETYSIAHIHTVGYQKEETEVEEDDEFTSTEISKNMLQNLRAISHGRTLNKTIQDLYELYCLKRYEETGPHHD